MNAQEPQDEIAPVSPIVLFLQKNSWVYGAVVVFLVAFVAGGIYMANRPQHGSWRYGLCRTFVDFEFAYPITFDILSVTEDSNSTRFFMAEKNPFGNERIIQVDCDYQVTDTGVFMTRMMLERKNIPPGTLAYYNRMIPTLLSLKTLDTELPKPLPRSLDKLKR